MLVEYASGEEGALADATFGTCGVPKYFYCIPIIGQSSTSTGICRRDKLYAGVHHKWTLPA